MTNKRQTLNHLEYFRLHKYLKFHKSLLTLTNYKHYFKYKYSKHLNKKCILNIKNITHIIKKNIFSHIKH